MDDMGTARLSAGPPGRGKAGEATQAQCEELLLGSLFLAGCPQGQQACAGRPQPITGITDLTKLDTWRELRREQQEMQNKHAQTPHEEWLKEEI